MSAFLLPMRSVAVLLLLLAMSTYAFAQDKAQKAPVSQGFYQDSVLATLTSAPERIVVINTRQGKIKIQIFDQAAPKTAAAFLRLVESGFYNNTTFHRLKPGYMIQGGDPRSKDDSLQDDGVVPLVARPRAEINKLKHERGIVSFAGRGDMDETNSEFFIVHQTNKTLDYRYAIIGQVVEGMEVVDKIANLPKLYRDNPGKESEMIRVSIDQDERFAIKVTTPLQEESSY